MNGIPTGIPATIEGGDFIVEVQARNDPHWKEAIMESPYEPALYGKPHSFSDFVHARIFADLHHKRINLPTRVNARRLCYIHFKSHHLEPDTWHLYHKKNAFEYLQSAIKGCDDLMRTGHITETR